MVQSNSMCTNDLSLGKSEIEMMREENGESLSVGGTQPVIVGFEDSEKGP